MIVLNLVLIVLGITLEPIPLTAFILILASEGGVRKGAGFIFGWLVSLVIVIAFTVLVTGNNSPKPRTAPSLAALAAKLAIGAGLLVIAIRCFWKLGKPKPPKSPPVADAHRQHGAVVRHRSRARHPALGLIAAGVTVTVERSFRSGRVTLALALFCVIATSSLLAMEIYAGFRPPASAGVPRPVSALDQHPYRPGHGHRVCGTRFLSMCYIVT